MKLARFGAPGAERPGLILPDGTRIDVSGQVRDYDEAFFAGDGVQNLRTWLDTSIRFPSSRITPGRSAPGGPNRASFIPWSPRRRWDRPGR